MATTQKKRYKPTREQQRQFIKQYFPKVLPSEAARKLIAKNDPNFTEAGLFRFLATDGLEREFAIYCWLRAMKQKFDRTKYFASPIDKPDFDTPEPSSFAPQTTSLDNWLNATIAQSLLDLDRAATEPRRWDLRHWVAIVLAIELAIGCGILIRGSQPSTSTVQTSQQ